MRKGLFCRIMGDKKERLIYYNDNVTRGDDTELIILKMSDKYG